jgi:AcrR family transcriptional regulator
MQISKKDVTGMNEKRLHIIEAAVKCFAHKGFHATSIQEIADTAGIAKGSLYFYFKSKEDLLLSTFQYYYDNVIAQLSTVSEDQSLSPKERLSKLLYVQFIQLTDYRDIILMLLHEQMIQINDDMKQLFFNIRAYTIYSFYHQIIEIYGEKAMPYAIDGAVVLKGLVGEYMSYLIIDQMDLDLWQLTQSIIARLDDHIHGMISSAQKPIFTEQNMHHFISIGKKRFEQVTRTIIEEIEDFQNFIQEGMNESEDRCEILACLDALKEEITFDKPRVIVLRTLFSYMRNKSNNSLEAKLDALERYVMNHYVIA